VGASKELIGKLEKKDFT